MSAAPATPVDFVAIGVRLRWLLFCRAVLVAAVPAAVALSDQPAYGVQTLLGYGVGWLLITVPTLLAPRLGRGAAMIAFRIQLLLDGLLLCLLWRALGGLDGSGWYLVWLHGVAVTLLASFRTGVKLAVWQGTLALVSLEATAAGLWGPVSEVPMTRLALYEGLLLATVMVVAGFAAVNERELRRRRYDSDVLRRLAFQVAGDAGVDDIQVLLATFATEQLLAPRSAVLAWRQEPVGGAVDEVTAIVADRAGALNRPAVADQHRDALVTRALDRGQTLLQSRLDPATDPWLAEQLPDARDVIAVPFALDQVSGVLVMECRGSRWRRVESRVRDTAEQAVAHAAMALSRAVLSERIRLAAQTDGLTGLGNRRQFDTRLTTELERARFTDRPVALLMIDLDHFKQLNDRHGHQTGDEVLRWAAAAVGARCPDGALAARYGGEEFAVVLGGTDLDAAVETAEAIRVALRAPGSPVPVTASIGVACTSRHGVDGPALLRAADAALYEAKGAGRDRVVRARLSGQLVA